MVRKVWRQGKAMLVTKRWLIATIRSLARTKSCHEHIFSQTDTQNPHVKLKECKEAKYCHKITTICMSISGLLYYKHSTARPVQQCGNRSSRRTAPSSMDPCPPTVCKGHRVGPRLSATSFWSLEKHTEISCRAWIPRYMYIDHVYIYISLEIHTEISCRACM